MSSPSSGHLNFKRMRLGTRSCAECRRRKVRCMWMAPGQPCQSCVLHDTPCRSQQPKETGTRADDVQERVQKLERLVRQLYQTISVNGESSSLVENELSPSQAVHILSPPNALGGRRNTEELEFTESTDQGVGLEDAPLIKLFQEAMEIQTAAKLRHHGRLTSSDHRTIIEALKALLPSPNDLNLILQLTVKYWKLWWGWPLSSSSEHAANQPQSSVIETRDFIVKSMESESSMVIAKTVTWLALCLQQCPANLDNQKTSLPAPLDVMLDCYIRGVESLLATDTDFGVSLDRLECLMLCARLDINMGKPLKGWRHTRSAINSAVLMGLHHTKARSERQQSLWSLIWQTDRQLSLILGFPYAVPDSYLIPSKLQAQQSVVSLFKRNLGIIAGHIGERNQNHLTVEYSVTLQLEQDLLRCRDELPVGWWDSTTHPDLSLEILYIQSVCKMHYFQLHKMLHLPYMLKSPNDARFEHSRVSILRACREMVVTYENLRKSSEVAVLICDLMDFQVFSAAVVLVVHLLSQDSNWDISENARDWDTIRDLSKTFKKLSEAKSCAVASQAADLLDYLFMASHGLYTATEDYEAEIPYFGKVRITRRGLWPLPDSSSPSHILAPSVESPAALAATNSMIEFSGNYFLPHDQNPMAVYSHNEELGIDWTAMISQNSQYDWSQLFCGSSTGQSMMH